MTTQAKRALQKALYRIGSQGYHDSACPEALVIALREAGAPIGVLDGFYCGREGRVTHDIGGIKVVHTWHRMESSGRYEVLAYLAN